MNKHTKSLRCKKLVQNFLMKMIYVRACTGLILRRNLIRLAAYIYFNIVALSAG